MEPIIERAFLLDTEIKSASLDDNGTLHLVGYASTYEQDRDREAVAPTALQNGVKGYLRNPILLYNHDPSRPIGRITKAVVDHIGLHIEAEVPPPPTGTESWHIKAYSDIKHGIVKTFSIGGLFKRLKNIITEMDLCEISAVPIPANPSSLFSVVQKSYQLPSAGRAAEFDLTKLRPDAFNRAVDTLPRA